MLLEGQLRKDDWGAERTFLVNLATGSAQMLDLRTSDGSTSISNGTVELVELEAKPTLVFTAFAVDDTSQAGPMIWDRVLPDD